MGSRWPWARGLILDIIKEKATFRRLWAEKSNTPFLPSCILLMQLGSSSLPLTAHRLVCYSHYKDIL